MRLKGSCHCGAVRFQVEAPSPVPYMRCYCSICRKVAGGGGYAINLGADAASLKIEGEDQIRVYETSPDKSNDAAKCGRRFCGGCGTALWHFDPTWPDLVHPFASAIDTDLPEAPARSHIMLSSKAGWAPVDIGPGDETFEEYPDRSLSAWHVAHGFSGEGD